MTNEQAGLHRLTDASRAGDLIAPLYDLAVRAGDAIMNAYRGGDLGVQAKADESPLTRADRAAHQIITDGLATLAPGIPVLSEEGSHAEFEERAEWRELWLVDPLDGTKEFIAGRTEFTVNIALIQDGVPVLGVVYAPALQEGFAGVAPADSPAPPTDGAAPANNRTALDESGPAPLTTNRAAVAADRSAFYHAPPGGGPDPPGSRLERVSLRPSGGTAPQGGAGHRPAMTSDARASGGPGPLRVVASRSHLNAQTTAYIDSLERLVAPRPLERVSYGSSLKLCRLADGSADIYPRFGPTMEWDTAAAHAVLRATGGECVAAATPLRYNKPDLHNPYFVAYAPPARDLVIE